MNIAIISLPYARTPPIGYGGIERVVHILVEQLVKEGHQVTMFATPGSYCSGKTIEVSGYDPSRAPSGVHKKADFLSEEPLYEAVQNYLKSHTVDVIHDWSFQNLFVLRHQGEFPSLISTCVPPSPRYRRPNLVACSKAHAALHTASTRYVYYGLDLDKWNFQYRKKDYFIHISKIAHYKAQHIAMLAARRIGARLKIAGNIEGARYYNLFFRPMLWFSPKISYIGEIQGTNRHLMEARALIQTPKWFDAFPLVVLESFASGTPVIGLAAGGVPEQIKDGVNGFLCHSVSDIADAMANINKIDPRACREYAETHFSAKRMAHDYIALYQQVMEGETW